MNSIGAFLLAALLTAALAVLFGGVLIRILGGIGLRKRPHRDPAGRPAGADKDELAQARYYAAELRRATRFRTPLVEALPDSLSRSVCVDLYVNNAEQFRMSIVSFDIFLLHSADSGIDSAGARDRCQVTAVRTATGADDIQLFMDAAEVLPYRLDPGEHVLFRLFLDLPRALAGARVFLGGWVVEDTGRKREFYWQVERKSAE